MTESTLKFMHRAYNASISGNKMTNILDILTGFQKRLLQYEVPEEDATEFDVYLRDIESSIRIRERTFQMTNLVSDIVFTMMYIIIWANKERALDIDIDILARRKALESELTKLLEKSDIHDRFGIRGIVLNNDSEDDHIEIQKLYSLANYFHNILTESSRKDVASFRKWLENNTRIDAHTKRRILHLLDIPFKVYNIKDYIKNPKGNGYQSYHFVLMVEMYSDYMPGAEFEVQLRTFAMHQHAVNGDSNHTDYKNSIGDELKKVFMIDDFAKANIVGFTSYMSVDDDIDGIHWAKQLYNRRISNTLVD